MIESSAEFKFIVVLLVVEVLAFLVAAAVVARSGTRRGSVLAVLGAVLAAVGSAVLAAPSVQQTFFDGSSIAEFIYFHHEHVQTILVAARVLGVVMLVAGLAQLLRNSSTTTSAGLYGGPPSG